MWNPISIIHLGAPGSHAARGGIRHLAYPKQTPGGMWNVEDLKKTPWKICILAETLWKMLI